MPESPKTCKELLAEARAAYHTLAVTQQQVSVSYGDRSITYRPADSNRLLAYIRSLECDPECGEFGRRRRPFTMSDA